MHLVSVTSAIALCLVIACGPSGRDPNSVVDAGTDATDDPNAIVTGRVFAPNQGPGQAPPGLEIPIAGAIIYVTDTRPPPIPDKVYCEKCVDTPNGGTVSNADGTFTLKVLPGNYWLVIQKGQYRIEQQLALSQGPMPLTPAQTTLPSQWKPEAGLFMPKIAMAQGTNDNIEDILGKLGVGTMSGNGFSNPNGENGVELDVYSYSGTAAGSVTALLQNMDQMRKYHIIFFPCAVSMSSIDMLLQDQTVLANIRRYINEGGKLYVTDWSGELVDRAFPQQIELGNDDFGGQQDSTGTYDPVTFGGTLMTIGDADGSYYDLDDGNAIDQGLNGWLGLQSGPTEDGTVMMYNASNFAVTGLYNWINKVNPVQIGVDMNSMPVYDAPKVWMTGSGPGGPSKPIAVTYEPTGCGKVLFTAFQTSNSAHTGLYPQERALLYLIMEIQTCSSTPIL